MVLEQRWAEKRTAGLVVKVNGGAPLEGGSLSSGLWAVLVFTEAFVGRLLCGGVGAASRAVLFPGR